MSDTSHSHTRSAQALPGFLLVAVGGRLAVVLVGCLLRGTPLAFADEPEATVVVTAEPFSEAEERAPTAFTTVINPAPHTEQAETVADALSEVAGVQVRRFGGLGSFSTISIRGSTPNQVQVFLDGIPLSRAQDETVNLGDLPLDALERIEVYRGTAPIDFGVSAIGGVVNLVTKKPTENPETTTMAGYGSFDTRKVVLSHSRKLGGFDLLGHVTYLGSKGDFTFHDDNGTPQNPYDDSTEKRINNHFNAVDTLVKAGYALSDDAEVDLTSDFFYKDQGVPGIGSNQAPNPYQQKLRSLNYLRLQRRRLGEVADFEATGYGIYERDRFVDKTGELFGVNEDTVNESTIGGGRLSTDVYPTLDPNLSKYVGQHLVRAIGELSYQIFSSDNRLATIPGLPDQTRLQLAAGLQDDVSFLGDHVIVVPAVRFEHLEDQSSGGTRAGRPLGESSSVRRDLWSPSLGAQVRPWPWLVVQGNLGVFRRAPNFSELYGNRGFVRGNPELQPEKSTNRDIGFTVSWVNQWWFDNVYFQYAYFNNDADDLIVFVQTSQQFFRPLNVGAARLRGNELTLHLAALNLLSLDANYTNQDSENRSERPEHRGRQLPGRPQNEVYVRPQIANDLGRVYYEFNLVSGDYLNLSNFTELPTRDLHNIGGAWNVTDWLTLSFEARNITNNQIVDLQGFPLPGRSFFGTVTTTF